MSNFRILKSNKGFFETEARCFSLIAKKLGHSNFTVNLVSGKKNEYGCLILCRDAA